METLLQPVQQSKRILVLDVLRGFALLGILMVNMPVFNSPFAVLLGEQRLWTDPVNATAQWLIDFFFHGKFYVLFSFLFGLGFYFFLKKADEAGRAIMKVFRRRLVILLGFGVLHVLLLWYGDILVIYALFGFVLTWFRNKSDRSLLIWAAVFLMIPIVFTSLMIGAIHLAMGTPDIAAGIEASFAGQAAYFERFVAEAMNTYRTGSYSEILSLRLTEYSYIWGGIFSFFPFVMAMFLTGLLAGRRGWLADIRANKGFFKKLFWYSLPPALLANWLLATYAATASHVFPDIELLYMIIGFALGGPSMAFVYISLIVFCLNRGYFSWLSAKFAAVGRMALTNYLTQSIICTTLFYSYGLGLYGKVDILRGMWITLGIFIVQLVWSHFWLKRFRFGPFEWVWRTLTYGRRPPSNRAQ